MARSEIFQMSLIGGPNDAVIRMAAQDSRTRILAAAFRLETGHGLRPVSPGASKYLAPPPVAGAIDRPGH